jgi:hypothetical protein
VSQTPLSDLITLLCSDDSEELLARFHQQFLAGTVGVLMQNLPATRQPGERFQTGRSDNIGFAPVATPDGRTMVKACADPEQFVQRYPGAINTLMRGPDLLAMALKIPTLDGVLVCSALSLHSIPISREEIARLGSCATERPVVDA